MTLQVKRAQVGDHLSTNKKGALGAMAAQQSKEVCGLCFPLSEGRVLFLYAGLYEGCMGVAWETEMRVNCGAGEEARGRPEARGEAQRQPSGPARGGYAPLAFPTVDLLSMELLYGRAGRLTAKNGGLRPGQPAAVAAPRVRGC